jgi:lantibiotic modifying enzyme
MEVSAPTAWRPLLEGESADRALAAAEAIFRDLSGDPGHAIGPGVNRGLAGLALFFAYYERALGDAEAGELAGRYLEQAIAELAVPPAPASSLYHGFTGVAWVVEHLTGGEAAGDEGDDVNEEIDAALVSLLRRQPWRGEFDLLSGLVGWGVYALERLPRPAAAEMLPLIVDRLGECAERRAQGVVWRDPGHTAREPDLGMAHGSAGVIALLARMLREGSAGQAATSLIAAAVDGVLGVPANGEEVSLAWCEGDVGLSVALLAAAGVCGRDDWKLAASRRAARAAARFPDNAGTGGFDLALCHGTAGLSHLFHRLYQATADPALLAAARRWLERTLARRRPGEGIGGYLCWGRQADGQFDWLADPGFLGGAAGIGLALLAAATPIEPAWDRLLMLSDVTPQLSRG